MKRAVSISIGTSKRNKAVEIDLLGEHISIERLGTDGDMKKAAALFTELDGKVDALGVGGADLGMLVAGKWYPIQSVQYLVSGVKTTPVVDGAGLKNTLEPRVIAFMEKHLGDYIKEKKVFVTAGADRWGITAALLAGGYDCVFGDLMFATGLPIPIRGERSLKFLASVLVPLLGRLPFEWLYPIGEKQEKREPKFTKYYNWANIITGDRHYIVRHMPDRLDGKVLITNTTTQEDVALFKGAGVKYLITSTPNMNGRTFGTNMLEAALVAAAGKKRKLTLDELNELIDQLKLEPQIQELN